MKKKRLIIILSILFGLMLILYFCYKGLLLFIYNKTIDNYFDYYFDKFNVVGTITADRKYISKSDYLYVSLKENGYKNNLKIRNDFEGFESLNNRWYYQRGENDEIIKLVVFEEMHQFVFDIPDFYVYLYDYDKDRGILSYFKDFIVGDIEDADLFNFIRIKLMSADVEKILEKNNINNDFDLYQYVKNFDDNINVFSSIKKIKEVYTLKEIVGDIIIGQVADANDITLINGNYSGFICNHDDYRYVFVFYNEYTYMITFGKPKYFPDEYIQDFISTLVIEE